MLRQDRRRHAPHAARGADRPLQHPRAGEVLHRARRRRLRRLRAGARPLPARARRPCGATSTSACQCSCSTAASCRRTPSAPARPGRDAGSGRAGRQHREVRRRASRSSASIPTRSASTASCSRSHRRRRAAALAGVLEGRAASRAVTLAEARLDDGQRLLAFNDLFIGARTHVSARYRLRVGGRDEAQSSSGVLVSTGAGSTGWMSSVFNMAAGVGRFVGRQAGQVVRLDWEDRRLLFAVREPFASRHSARRHRRRAGRGRERAGRRVADAVRRRHLQRRHRGRLSRVQLRRHGAGQRGGATRDARDGGTKGGCEWVSGAGETRAARTCAGHGGPRDLHRARRRAAGTAGPARRGALRGALGASRRVRPARTSRSSPPRAASWRRRPGSVPSTSSSSTPSATRTAIRGVG